MTSDLLLFYSLMGFLLVGFSASVVGSVIDLRPKRQGPPINWPRFEGQPHDINENEGHD